MQKKASTHLANLMEKEKLEKIFKIQLFLNHQ